jgi:ATP-dependent Zn protease
MVENSEANANEKKPEEKRSFPFWVVILGVWMFFVMKRVSDLTITQNDVFGEMKGEGGAADKQFITTRVDDPQLATKLREKGISFSGAREDNFFRDILSWVLPAVVFFGLWMFFLNRAAGDGNNALGGVMQARRECMSKTSSRSGSRTCRA